MFQNKLLWAISQQTAAELVYRRVDASLPLLGMLSIIHGEEKHIDINEAFFTELGIGEYD